MSSSEPCSVSFQCFLKKRLHHQTESKKREKKKEKEGETTLSHLKLVGNILKRRTLDLNPFFSHRSLKRIFLFNLSCLEISCRFSHRVSLNIRHDQKACLFLRYYLNERPTDPLWSRGWAEPKQPTGKIRVGMSILEKESRSSMRNKRFDMNMLFGELLIQLENSFACVDRRYLILLYI